LHVQRAKTDALFMEIDAEADVEEAVHAIEHANADACFDNPAPGHNDHVVGTSTPTVDLTSTGDIHTADSGEEEQDMGHRRGHTSCSMLVGDPQLHFPKLMVGEDLD